MELTAEISYKIEKDNVLITEYDIVDENEIQLKKIKVREDTYAYNGKCLLLIDSKMYNIRGDAWIPEIEDVISYHMKK